MEEIETCYVSAMDPGETTGLALLLLESNAFHLLETCTVPYLPDRKITPLDKLWSWAESQNDFKHVLVYEDFHVRTGVPQVNTTALRILGGMEDRIMRSNPYERVISQNPAHKAAVPDPLLGALGLRASGPDARHIRDAFRHVVVWARGWGYAPMFP